MAINRSLNKHCAALIGINRRYPTAPLPVGKAQTPSAARTSSLQKPSQREMHLCKQQLFHMMEKRTGTIFLCPANPACR